MIRSIHSSQGSLSRHMRSKATRKNAIDARYRFEDVHALSLSDQGTAVANATETKGSQKLARGEQRMKTSHLKTILYHALRAMNTVRRRNDVCRDLLSVAIKVLPDDEETFRRTRDPQERMYWGPKITWTHQSAQMSSVTTGGVPCSSVAVVRKACRKYALSAQQPLAGAY